MHCWTLRASQDLWRPWPSRRETRVTPWPVNLTPDLHHGHLRTIPTAPIHVFLYLLSASILQSWIEHQRCLLPGVNSLASTQGRQQTLLPKTRRLNDLIEEQRKGGESNNPKGNHVHCWAPLPDSWEDGGQRSLFLSIGPDCSCLWPSDVFKEPGTWPVCKTRELGEWLEPPAWGCHMKHRMAN